MKHYRVRLWGYGGEAAYISLTQEQYEYWSAFKDDETREDGEYEIIEYMCDPDTWLTENTIPEGTDFLCHKYDDGTGIIREYRNPWHEAPTEYAHAFGATDDCRVSVVEVDSDEYNANHILDVIDSKESSEINHENDYEFIEYGELTDYKGNPVEEPDYVCQFWSAEKGTFFDGAFSTEEEFDIKKLKLITQEFPNGDDVVVRVDYDGQEVYNDGAETNGKGYSVYFWSNK